MFSHVHLGSNDVERARAYYDALMAVLGAGPGRKDPDRNRYFYNHDGAMLIVGEPLDKETATPGNGMTIGFAVADEAMGLKWHEVATSNGGTAIGEAPGVHARAVGSVFLAYARDPDGNKLCALKIMDQ